MKRPLFLVWLLALLLAPAGICAPPDPNFSGTWKQSNERCTPTRTGNVTLHIDHRDPDLTVETTVLRSSGPPRHAMQPYTTDGKSSISTGVDGDEFYTSVHWSGLGLVFAIEEHENGRIILSEETWTLIENGTAFERSRERIGSPDRAGRQTILYLRDAPRP